jgi:bis(5'-adenosyl)-triphosphatase
VNIKPILPGHVLVVPDRQVPRMTDLSPAEITDLFVTVQKVQRMLAKKYFHPAPSPSDSSSPQVIVAGDGNEEGSATVAGGIPEDGSFNIAIQDGREAGQTVPHVHCHVIPRARGDEAGDELYDRLQGEEGNVGGGFWDLGRPVQEGRFPRIEDSARKPRSVQDMRREAEGYRVLMEGVE